MSLSGIWGEPTLQSLMKILNEIATWVVKRMGHSGIPFMRPEKNLEYGLVL
jgi:hypothetical protein